MPDETVLRSEGGEFDAILAAQGIGKAFLCDAAMRAFRAGECLRYVADPKADIRYWFWAPKGAWPQTRILAVGATGSLRAVSGALDEKLFGARHLDLARCVLASSVNRSARDGAISADLGARRGFLALARPISYRYALPLGTSYESFLARLGQHSRRNVHRARRLADEARFQFTFDSSAPSPESFSERAALGALTRPAAKTPARLAELDRILAARPRPFTSAVRSADSSLISFAAGFLAGNAAFLYVQLNDSTLPNADLALLNRSFLVEQLLRQGIEELIFPGGVKGVLEHACVREFGFELVLARNSALARMKLRFWRARAPDHPAARMLDSRRSGLSGLIRSAPR